MKYPIIKVRTKDKLELYGLFLEAPKSKTVLINIHGTASNFYEEDFIKVLAEKLVTKNISLLSTNNRGTSVYDPYQVSGAAVEKFEDCLKDIDAWIELVLKQGYKKIILSGHSLGTEKVVYYMSHGKYKDKVSAIILLAPADSFGSHRLHEGKPNTKTTRRVDILLKKAEKLIQAGQGDKFLPRDAYGSHEGIMPKSAASFVNFLGKNSKLTAALSFHKNKLTAYSKITTPILAVIGDQSEYTAIPTAEALKLLERENKNTETYLFKNCDHDFQGQEAELAKTVIKFLIKNNL